MSFGTKIWNSSSVPIFDSTLNQIRFVEAATTPAIPNGSFYDVTIPGLQNTPDWVVIVYARGSYANNSVQINSGSFRINHQGAFSTAYDYWVLRQ